MRRLALTLVGLATLAASALAETLERPEFRVEIPAGFDRAPEDVQNLFNEQAASMVRAMPKEALVEGPAEAWVWIGNASTRRDETIVVLRLPMSGAFTRKQEFRDNVLRGATEGMVARVADLTTGTAGAGLEALHGRFVGRVENEGDRASRGLWVPRPDFVLVVHWLAPAFAEADGAAAWDRLVREIVVSGAGTGDPSDEAAAMGLGLLELGRLLIATAAALLLLFAAFVFFLYRRRRA
jgi:hypothetical protein